MSFFKRLFAKSQAPDRAEASAYWVYVRCNRCGEIIRSRIDLYNDLSIDYGDKGLGMTKYFCRKTLIGSHRCFQPIEVELTFNSQRELIQREIRGGVYVSESEYLASQAESG
jgi:DNA-directed RNA polymerase subunit N (RpoN/RPB10)